MPELETPVISSSDNASGPRVSAKKEAQLEKALDSIRQKYGADAIVRGSLLHKKERF